MLGRAATCSWSSLLLPSTSFASPVAQFSSKPNSKKTTTTSWKGHLSKQLSSPSVFPANPTYRARNIAQPNNMTRPAQTFDYLLVLDFEATCDSEGLIQPFPEIIEMPVVVLNTTTWQAEGKFHQYVRPTVRPAITPFCTHLTGIIQEMVEEQPTLPETLARFDAFLAEKNMLTSRFAFVTCGDWDLGVMLPSEAKNKQIDLPSYFSNWINIKKSYAEHTGKFAKGLRDLLRSFKLEHVGRLHSGIDDVQNIVAITKAIAGDGYVYRINGSTRTTSVGKKRLFNDTTVS